MIEERSTVATIADERHLGRYSGLVGIVVERRRVTPPGVQARFEYGVDVSGRGANVSAWFTRRELVPLRLAATALPERRSRLIR